MWLRRFGERWICWQKSSPSSGNRSPFIIGIPIQQPRHFFGRQRELKRLFNLLKSHPLQNAAIIGKRRSGKTSLLNYLQKITTTPSDQLRPGHKVDWLPNPQHYRWVFVNLQDSRMSQRDQLLRRLLNHSQCHPILLQILCRERLFYREATVYTQMESGSVQGLAAPSIPQCWGTLKPSHPNYSMAFPVARHLAQSLKAQGSEVPQAWGIEGALGVALPN